MIHLLPVRYPRSHCSSYFSRLEPHIGAETSPNNALSVQHTEKSANIALRLHGCTCAGRSLSAIGRSITPSAPFHSHSPWQATSYVSLSAIVSTRPTPKFEACIPMHWHISLSAVYCLRIWPKTFQIARRYGFASLREGMVRVIDQHSGRNPAAVAFSMTPDYLALDYLAQLIRTLCIYLSCRTPTLPLCSNQTPLPANHAHHLLSPCARRTHLNRQYFPHRPQRSSRTCGCQGPSEGQIPCNSTQLRRSSETIAGTPQPRPATGAISQARRARPHPASGAVCQTRRAQLRSTRTSVSQTRSPSGAVWRAPPSRRRACAAP
jgi:hypothetical protein